MILHRFVDSNGVLAHGQNYSDGITNRGGNPD